MKKFLTVIFTSAVMISSMAGATIVSAETTTAAESSQKLHKEKVHNSSIGKVVTVNENEITILKAEMPERENLKDDSDRPEPPADGERPEPPNDGERPEPPADGERPEPLADGERPERPFGKNKMEELNFSDTETTITVSSDIEIYKMTGLGRHKSEEENKEESKEIIDISEISADDVINIIYDEDGTTVKAILLMEQPENITE